MIDHFSIFFSSNIHNIKNSGRHLPILECIEEEKEKPEDCRLDSRKILEFLFDADP